MEAAVVRTKKPNLLGEVLLSTKQITQNQLNQALALKKEKGLKIGQALVFLGIISEAELSEALKQQGKMLCINLDPDIVDWTLAGQIKEEFARNFNIIVINRIAGITTVAMGDPTDLSTLDEIAIQVKTRLLPVYAEPVKIQACLDRLYGTESKQEDSLDEIADSLDMDGSNVSFAELTPDESNPDEALNESVVNMVRSLLQEAYDIQASDIHLEPRRSHFVVRFRLDGKLYERLRIDRAWARPCMARLKVLAQLDPSQNRLPQDGRAQARIGDHPVDLCIATTPSLNGEGAVIRILDSGREIHSLDRLGLDANQINSLKQALKGGSGFILATGPTGSGKTSTLYALLQELNSPEKKIITLEDPVEHHLEGVTQINVNNKIELTFARGLRSILRQDPDVVLVGEIRDEETARIAVQAAITGHLVFSKLHTTGTVETLTRLMDIGIERYLIADSVRCVIAQRLVRRICPHCRTSVQGDLESLIQLGLEKDETVFYEGTGCDACRNTGYLGRMAIHEILLITPELTEMIRKNVGSDLIRMKACETGMFTIQMDAIRKAKAGETTLSEVIDATTRG